MQDSEGSNDLLHLGDLASGFPEDLGASTDSHLHNLDVVGRTDLNLLAEEDRMSLNELAPAEIQEWCLSRIAEYQNHNFLLREVHGPAARTKISTNKSYIRALRSAYNDAAPINRYFPPEMLMEIFSHVHPAVMPRPRVPLLHVCRYWRRLALNTPQFWAGLLSLPTWKTWNPEHYIGRFRAVLVRSAPASLDVVVPYYSHDIVHILTPHASRIFSFAAGPTLYDFEETAQVRIEQRMPCPRHHLATRPSLRYTSTLTFDFLLYPNIRSLELQHTYFHPLTTPYPSLRHLTLDHCSLRRFSIADDVPSLYVVHNALELLPSLETLSLTCCLSDIDPDDIAAALPVPDLTTTVCLPHLRLLELKDVSDYIVELISHLDFPSTAALVLEPIYTGDFDSTLQTAVPLPAGFTSSSPAPDTELRLLLVFNRDAKLARWEPHGDGARPVRVTLPGGTSDAPTIARFSHALAAAFAPARGLTTLTVVGSGASRAYRYWDDLLPALPVLRRLAYDSAGWEDTRMLVYQLEKTGARGWDGWDGRACACPLLEDVRLEWCLPHGVNSSSGPDLGEGGDWEELRERDEGGPRGRGHREEGLMASLYTFSDTLRTCLAVRASDRGGRCARLRRLEVRPVLSQSQFDAEGVVLQGWQVALVEARLRDRLGEFVEDIVVVSVLRGSTNSGYPGSASLGECFL